MSTSSGTKIDVETALAPLRSTAIAELELYREKVEELVATEYIQQSTTTFNIESPDLPLLAPALLGRRRMGGEQAAHQGGCRAVPVSRSPRLLGVSLELVGRGLQPAPRCSATPLGSAPKCPICSAARQRKKKGPTGGGTSRR
jgi:hypothetical protein